MTGILMLFIALTRIITAFIDYNLVSTTLPELENYSYTMSEVMPWTTLLLGLVALLIARIWNMGMVIKREQELTI